MERDRCARNWARPAPAPPRKQPKRFRSLVRGDCLPIMSRLHENRVSRLEILRTRTDHDTQIFQLGPYSNDISIAVFFAEPVPRAALIDTETSLITPQYRQVHSKSCSSCACRSPNDYLLSHTTALASHASYRPYAVQHMIRPPSASSKRSTAADAATSSTSESRVEAPPNATTRRTARRAEPADSTSLNAARSIVPPGKAMVSVSGRRLDESTSGTPAATGVRHTNGTAKKLETHINVSGRAANVSAGQSAQTPVNARSKIQGASSLK